MSRYRVTCIKRDSANPDCLIDTVGFAGQIYDINEAIRWLDAAPGNQLWVVDDSGESVWVSPRQHSRTGRYFLATERDGQPLNKLASLPECQKAAVETVSAFRFGARSQGARASVQG